MFENFREDEWETYVEKNILDPLLAPHIVAFGCSVAAVRDSNQSDRAVDHFEDILEVCRHSRAIRIEVGLLSQMQPEAIELMIQGLQFSLNNAMSADKMPADKVRAFKHALKNIEHRLELLQSDDELELEPVGAVEKEQPSSKTNPDQPR